MSSKVWHLGADIDTDALAPGAWMQHGVDVIAQHCLENTLPAFAREVKPGDLIVAGPNFGIGSSREQAAAALVHLGVAAVIAPSWGGLFFRNAFNLGLLLLTCDDVDALRGHRALHLDRDRCTLSLPDGTPVPLHAVPDFLLDMVRQGGLMAALRARLKNPSGSSNTHPSLTTEPHP
ncbi:MAG: 3-isopropylmalate dehydratase [Betaproteobacteria bacterium]|jgi:3-isopropylmalate/(R)-2-methylmalate dehydratase small subunit|nr:3-isopropylmalate dehydratase [Betaproteobacteria bacterium]